jgi:hypothetical protein
MQMLLVVKGELVRIEVAVFGSSALQLLQRTKRIVGMAVLVSSNIVAMHKN